MQEMQKTYVQSLGWEDPLEKGTAAHSSILAWKIPWTEEPSGLQSMGSQRVRCDLVTEHAYQGRRDERGWLDGDGKRGRGRKRGVKTLCEVLHPSTQVSSLAFPPAL